MSHIKQMISIQAFTRGKVLAMLQMSEDTYGNYVMEHALAYLDKQLGENVMSRELKLNSLFWAWWRNHWHDADMAFVDEAKGMSLAERQLYYEIVHDLELFEYTPQRTIFLDAFRSMKSTPQVKHQL